ncbi:DUF6701 domain-containing protein [Aliivibrio fischeri]|uniref:DUF6701 domain-containing protein n=1 Tax=Aliivibrio fischeri TaxID=668 RepID=UPI000B2378B1|nr:DUF6701 domain-containing protein [Aliivibrio fischeri]
MNKVCIYFIGCISLFCFSMNSSAEIKQELRTIDDMCKYFPATAQTWFDGGGSTQLIVDGEKGHNRSYIETPNRKVGFPLGSMNLKSGNTCDDGNGESGDCIADPALIVPQLSISTEFTGVDGAINEFSDVTIEPGHYTDINVTGGNPLDYAQVTLLPGTYWINRFNIGGYTEIHFSNIEKTVIHIEQLGTSGYILYNHNAEPDNLLIIGHGSSSNMLVAGANILKAHLYSENNIALNGNVSVYGAVTAKTLRLFSNSRIIGQSECINPSNDIQLVISPTSGKGLACDGIEIDFSLVDTNGEVVEGKGQELQVTSAPVATGDRNSACWSDDGNITTPECNHADDSRFETVFPSSGPAVVTRYIHSKFLNSYNVSATVSSENLTTTEGPYEFIAKAISIVPSEGVDGSDSHQVAGRPYPFRLKIRGKENGNGNMLNCHIIKETTDIDVTFSNSVLPATSNENIEVKKEGSGWTEANKSLSISFVNGVAGGDENQADGSLQARLNDAGKAKLTASANIQGDTFTTSEQFYFRPFTAALCDQLSTLPSYIDELNGAYLTSGTDFNAYLKAVNWIKELDSGTYGNGIPDYDHPSLVCSQTVTPSYITHSEGSAKLSLSSQVYYPQSGAIGVITVDGQPIADFNKEVTNENQNLSTKINWNEVGTLSFDVFQNDYFNRSGFNIPSTASKVGRFYPAYFSITNTEWDYPQKQGTSEGSFVYMDQFFKNVDFQVTAYSALDSEVTNYGQFNNELKSRFSLVGEYASRLNITDVDLDETHWGDKAVWQVTNLDHAVIWSKKEGAPSFGNRTTVVDGPFNTSGHSSSETTSLGLKIGGVDPVTFIKDQQLVEAELLSQPDVRYGRMVLDNVGVASGQSVSVPLRVEYWDGQRFILSKEDDAAVFNGSSYCKHTIWPESDKESTAKLMGTGGTKSGLNSIDLIAEPDNHQLREQIRFWLRLSEGSPQLSEKHTYCELKPSGLYLQPWLQFNWRGKGDEDPSTLVTFGVYRGNDRVIFRGESNIIGTSN